MGVAEALDSTDRQTRLEVVTVSANLGDRLGAVVALDNLRGIFGRFDPTYGGKAAKLTVEIVGRRATSRVKQVMRSCNSLGRHGS